MLQDYQKQPEITTLTVAVAIFLGPGRQTAGARDAVPPPPGNRSVQELLQTSKPLYVRSAQQCAALSATGEAVLAEPVRGVKRAVMTTA